MLRIRNQKIKIVYVTILAFGMLALDQCTKYLIVSNLTTSDVITIIDGFFNIVHYRNTGIAFSMFAGDQYIMLRNIVLTAVGFFIISLLYAFLRSESNILLISGYSFVIGGAVGNIFDRLIRGSVVDFLQVHYQDVYYFPAFNVADSSVTMGAVLIVLSVVLANPHHNHLAHHCDNDFHYHNHHHHEHYHRHHHHHDGYSHEHEHSHGHSHEHEHNHEHEHSHEHEHNHDHEHSHEHEHNHEHEHSHDHEHEHNHEHEQSHEHNHEHNHSHEKQEQDNINK